jgi:hypothetical protein
MRDMHGALAIYLGKSVYTVHRNWSVHKAHQPKQFLISGTGLHKTVHTVARGFQIAIERLRLYRNALSG